MEANDWLTIECEIKVFLERLSAEQLDLAKEATAIKREHPNPKVAHGRNRSP